MRVFIPSEKSPVEKRVAIVPDTAKRLKALGFEISIEAGAGAASYYLDEEYEQAGARIATDRRSELASADMVLRLGKPSVEEAALQKSGSWSIGFLDPFNEGELIEQMAISGLTAVSMEMIPRTTLAQKMDGISSQANLAGYFAVIKAAERLNRILPMMMTPAGTISPARVFVIGVGVAGLQAIATAKRLGARVDAFDTRPVVEEQVKSLGAKFLKIDLGEMGQTDQGYAKELTDEQKQKQKAGMAKLCAQSDIVITTAKLFGRKAPQVIDETMLAGMRHGSVVVDLATETGGNVAGSRLDEEVLTDNGVRIIGVGKLECGVASHASQMYSANLYNFIEHFWDEEKKLFACDLSDELLKGCVIAHGGALVHERFAGKSKA